MFNTDSKEVTPVEIQIGPNTSVTGMAVRESELPVAATIDGTSYLMFLEIDTLRTLAKQPLYHVRDVHSIAVRDDMCYIVSTGADAVLRYRIEGHHARFVGTAWAPTLGASDTLHLNGLSTADKRLLCSGFGIKDGERWSTARNGFIFDIDNSAEVTHGIHHPHSVTSHQGEVFCLESVTGCLIGSDRSRWSVDRYARGLCFYAEGKAAIGSSIPLRSSDGRFQDVESPRTTCAIALVETKSGSRETYSLTEFNNEIYDIVALP